MKILLTGSSGFVGSRIYNKIKNKNIVKSINRKTFFENTIFLNIENILKHNNLKKIISFNPDILIYSSWYGIPNLNKKNSHLNYKKSLLFIKLLIQKCNLKKIIVLGSCLEYNFSKKNLKKKPLIIKKKNMHVLGLYKTKLYLDIKNFLNNFDKNINLIWLRLFYLYGYGQNEKSLIPYLVKNSKATPKKINMVLDYIHVDDVANLIPKIIKSKNISGIFNVANGKGLSILAIYKLIVKNLKRAINIDSNTKFKNHMYMVADISKTIKKFNWKPKINFNKGLKKMIKQYI
jgi:dTDP-6-deoxy-L-talose 4-dehydrogenase (NAD+)